MVQQLNLWNIVDDSVDGIGCPDGKGGNVNNLADGGEINLYLITKEKIKELQFYAPGFYEEQCPGRTGRRVILKLDKILKPIFKKENISK